MAAALRRWWRRMGAAMGSTPTVDLAPNLAGSNPNQPGPGLVNGPRCFSSQRPSANPLSRGGTRGRMVGSCKGSCPTTSRGTRSPKRCCNLGSASTSTSCRVPWGTRGSSRSARPLQRQHPERVSKIRGGQVGLLISREQGHSPLPCRDGNATAAKHLTIHPARGHGDPGLPWHSCCNWG